MSLDRSVTALKGVGNVMAKRLQKLGIITTRDLLYHFPFRYEDFSACKQISDLQDGEQVTMRAEVELIANKRTPRKRKMLTEAMVSDGQGRMRVVWFGQPFIAKQLSQGDTVYFSGTVKRSMYGLQMVNPHFEKEKKSSTNTARVVPIYPLTSGMSQKQMCALMAQALEHVDEVEEWLPDAVREKAGVIALPVALRQLHVPENMKVANVGIARLKFDELFRLQLRAELARAALQQEVAPQLTLEKDLIKKFVQSLPFDLTNAQRIAAWEVFQDCEHAHPMNRLLEGDVGSGKTVVAVMAALNAVANDVQVAVLAPTAVLANQHMHSFCSMLSRQNVTIALLTSANQEIVRDGECLSVKKPDVYNAVASGEVDMLLGTHALLVEDLQFRNLGLVIVDEQHRFGVEQRKTLKEKSGDNATSPHFLSMTATPIPRSFALTLYGELDLSVIDEMPPGRKPVKTSLIQPGQRDVAYDFIRDEVRDGRQAFVICSRIDNEQLTNNNKQRIDKKSVLAEYEKLSEHIFPDLRIAYLHGKLKAAEKDATMQAFVDGKVDILISTSVVEVGVDVPNASVMMIEGAEHFGLAQLHQFRGRVGRSDRQSYCLLFTESQSDDVRDRLDFFQNNTSGFAVAEYDLDRRGPGDVYGVEQSGLSQLKLATLHDMDLIKVARKIARELDVSKYPLLIEYVRDWEQSVHLE